MKRRAKKSLLFFIGNGKDFALKEAYDNSDLSLFKQTLREGGDPFKLNSRSIVFDITRKMKAIPNGAPESAYKTHLDFLSAIAELTEKPRFHIERSYLGHMNRKKQKSLISDIIEAVPAGNAQSLEILDKILQQSEVKLSAIDAHNIKLKFRSQSSGLIERAYSIA